MISRWKWMLKQTFKKLWFRATLFAIGRDNNGPFINSF